MEIEKRAEAEVPIEKVIADLTVSPDPEVHLAAVCKLFTGGATIVNIHSGQADQQKMIDFYGRSVLPHLAM